MKILIVNYRYFVSGGPERYMFNVINELAFKGHQIIPFSVRYSRNHPTPYAKYFVDPLGHPDEVYFKQQKLHMDTIYRTLARSFYDKRVENAVSQIIKATKPDIAYVLHYLRKLSPAVIVGLKKAKIPIVARLSDYAMLCPQAHFIRNDKACDLCSYNNFLSSVRYSCVQGSFIVSLINALAYWYHRYKGYFNLIDYFVVPSQFMFTKMVQAGFPKEKLQYIPTFVDNKTFSTEDNSTKENIVSYVGRVERIKGVHILVSAFVKLLQDESFRKWHLYIAGDGDPKYKAMLQSLVQASGFQNNVHFLGEVSVIEIVTLLGKSRLSVIPSLWYENLPNSLLESFSCGVPVVASDIGSLRECVIEGVTGHLFKPGDTDDLLKKFTFLLSNPDKLLPLGIKAREIVQKEYSSVKHITMLENVFSQLSNSHL